MIFQPRDAALLRWINGFGFASAEQITRYMGVYKATAYTRIKKLIDHGYLDRKRILHGQGRIHILTKKGILACSDHIRPVGDIRLGTFLHDLALVDLALDLSEATGGEFIPQRRLRHDEGLSGVGHFGRVSDGYLHLKGEDKPIAIELELSVKARSRLNSIITDYGSDLSVKEIWYFCHDQSVKCAVEKASKGYSFIKVFNRADIPKITKEVRHYG